MPASPTLRSLLRTPAFSTLAILTMALGIGATTALFTVVNAVILQPLAYPNAGRIVALNTSFPAKHHTSHSLTGGDFLDLRADSKSFSALSFYNGGEIGVRLRDHARFAQTFQVDTEFFKALHTRTALGRLPQAADATHAAVITTAFAIANWANPAAALGQTVSRGQQALPDHRAYR